MAESLLLLFSSTAVKNHMCGLPLSAVGCFVTSSLCALHAFRMRCFFFENRVWDVAASTSRKRASSCTMSFERSWEIRSVTSSSISSFAPSLSNSVLFFLFVSRLRSSAPGWLLPPSMGPVFLPPGCHAEAVTKSAFIDSDTLSQSLVLSKLAPLFWGSQRPVSWLAQNCVSETTCLNVQA